MDNLKQRETPCLDLILRTVWVEEQRLNKIYQPQIRLIRDSIDDIIGNFVIFDQLDAVTFDPKTEAALQTQLAKLANDANQIHLCIEQHLMSLLTPELQQAVHEYVSKRDLFLKRKQEADKLGGTPFYELDKTAYVPYSQPRDRSNVLAYLIEQKLNSCMPGSWFEYYLYDNNSTLTLPLDTASTSIAVMTEPFVTEPVVTDLVNHEPMEIVPAPVDLSLQLVGASSFTQTFSTETLIELISRKHGGITKTRQNLENLEVRARDGHPQSQLFLGYYYSHIHEFKNYKIRKNIPKAIEFLNAYISQNLSDPVAYFLLANTGQDDQRAYSFISNIIETESYKLKPIEINIFIELCYRTGRHEQAIEFIKKIRQKLPLEQEDWFNALGLNKEIVHKVIKELVPPHSAPIQAFLGDIYAQIESNSMQSVYYFLLALNNPTVTQQARDDVIYFLEKRGKELFDINFLVSTEPVKTEPVVTEPVVNLQDNVKTRSAISACYALVPILLEIDPLRSAFMFIAAENTVAFLCKEHPEHKLANTESSIIAFKALQSFLKKNRENRKEDTQEYIDALMALMFSYSIRYINGVSRYAQITERKNLEDFFVNYGMRWLHIGDYNNKKRALFMSIACNTCCVSGAMLGISAVILKEIMTGVVSICPEQSWIFKYNLECLLADSQHLLDSVLSAFQPQLDAVKNNALISTMILKDFKAVASSWCIIS